MLTLKILRDWIFKESVPHHFGTPTRFITYLPQNATRFPETRRASARSPASCRKRWRPAAPHPSPHCQNAPSVAPCTREDRAICCLSQRWRQLPDRKRIFSQTRTRIGPRASVKTLSCKLRADELPRTAEAAISGAGRGEARARMA